MADFDPISERLLIPIYVPLLFLLLVGSQRILQKSPEAKRPVYRTVIFGMGIVCLIYFSVSACSFLVNTYQNGAGGYNSYTWRYAIPIRWIKENPAKDVIYSNAPDAIYILTGKSTLMVPTKSSGAAMLSAFKAQLAAQNGLVVYFDENIVGRPYLVPEEEIVGHGFLDRLEIWPDGRIYKYKD